MKHFFLYLITFLSIQWLFSSCHALVEDEFPDFAKAPVINGILQADSTFNIHVSFSANLSESAPTPVENAQVIVLGDNSSPDTLRYTQKGWYSSTRTVKAGETYECIATIPGYLPLSARTTVPEPTEIDSTIFTDLVGRSEDGRKVSSMEFRLKNKPDKALFWDFSFKARGIKMEYDFDTKEESEEFRVWSGYFTMKAEQDSVFLYEPNPLQVFSNRKMTGNHHWVKFYFNEKNIYYRPGKDTVFIELRSIDQSLYDYQKQLYVYGSGGGSVLGSAYQNYPLYSNIKNGLGVFSSFTVSRKDIELKE